MDLDAQGQRPSRYIRSLAQLPSGVFRQVLDDLPLVQVMKILSSGNQYLRDCILSHTVYSNFFTPVDSIKNAIDLFALLREVYADHLSALPPGYHLYGFNYIMMTPSTGINYKASLSGFCTGMVNAIQERLTLSAEDYSLLVPYSTTLYPASLGDDYKSLLFTRNWIKDARHKLNAAKAEQWELAADLVAEYPGKLMLKKPLDPSQDGLRQNMKHIENNFRTRAKKLLKDNRCKQSHAQGNCKASVELIQVVPYDKHLWFFLDTLSKYPLKDDLPSTRLKDHLKNGSQTSNPQSKLLDNEALNKKHATIALDPGPTSSTKESSIGINSAFSYPSTIATDIKVVLDGLTNIYTGSSLLVITRINWEQSRPVFDQNNQPHECHMGFPAGVHRCPVRRQKPHDKREFEWLQAFLRVVTWMEENVAKISEE